MDVTWFPEKLAASIQPVAGCDNYALHISDGTVLSDDVIIHAPLAVLTQLETAIIRELKRQREPDDAKV